MPPQEVSNSITVTHEELARVLQRAGYTSDVVQELTAQLPDPVVVDRDANLLARYGVTRGRLMELMGASP
jgi:hypothetical protein